MDIIYIIFFIEAILAIVLVYLMVKNSDLRKKLEEEEETKKLELSDSELEMIRQYAKLTEQNKLLNRTIEIQESQFKGKMRKLESEIENLQNDKKIVFVDNSESYRQKIKEKNSKITSLEKSIEVLKNKNFYKVSFEKAEAEIEELKDKNRILEKKP